MSNFFKRSIARCWLLPAAGAAAALLCGCAVDQQKEVAQYRQVLALGPTTRSATQPSVEAGGAVSLTEAMLMANQSSEALAVSGETYLQAIIEKNRAADSFFPTVGLSPNYALTDSGSGRGQSQTTLTASASVNVFNGGSDVANLRAAQWRQRQQRQLLLDQQATLLLNVAQSYYKILQLRQQAQVLQDSITYQSERVRDTESRLRLGIAKPLDLAQSRADLAAASVALTQTQIDIRNTRATLAFLIGTSDAQGELRDDLQLPAQPASLDDFLAQAQRFRRDLLAAQDAVNAAEQAVRVAVGRYYPSVSVNFNYLLYHDPSQGGLWNGGIVANVPIFSAGSIEADVRAAWSRYRQAELSRQGLSRQIIQQVRQAYENFAGSGRKIADLNRQVDASTQALDLADRSYQLGNASNLDRLSAKNILLNAQLQLASERYNQKLTWLQLLRNSGRDVLRP